MKNIDELWKHSLSILEKKISKPSFETWLKSTKAHTLKKDTLTVVAPNEFARDWLEERYSDVISEVLYETTGEQLEVKFIIPHNQKEEEYDLPAPAKKVRKSDDEQHEIPQTLLIPKYTFDTFVIGSGNRFAHAASLAVAEAPAKAYNPLFIYGLSLIHI